MLKNLNVFKNFTGLNTVFAMIMAYLLYDEISLQLTWDRNISPRSCKMSGPTQPSSSPPLNAHWTMKWHKFNIQMVQIPPDTFSETLIPLICLNGTTEQATARSWSSIWISDLECSTLAEGLVWKPIWLEHVKTSLSLRKLLQGRDSWASPIIKSTNNDLWTTCLYWEK